MSRKILMGKFESRNRVRVALYVLSVLIHIALLVSLPKFSISPKPLSSVEFVELPAQAVQVHSHVVAPPRVTQETAGHSLKARSKFTEHSFAPSFLPTQNTADGDVAVAVHAANGERAPDDPRAEWGSGGRDFDRVADLGRFDQLYEVVDSRVVYPSVLVAHGIQGTVNARLIVNAKGVCDWKQTQISSAQANLKVYVLDVLKRVCTQNLSRYARKDANSNFDFSFQFALTEHNDKKLIADQKKVLGNVFLFYRNSQQSIAEWHLGPFRGMFPIPFVSLDFAWLQENYEKVVNSQDPLEEFKDHLTTEPAI
jgi:hypothetical protein